MRKLALFATVVCLISCYGMSADAQTQVWGSHFVGPSSIPINGDTNGTAGGFITMNQFCMSKYGQAAHMCTVDQFYGTAGAKTVGLTMWAKPSLSDCVWNPSATPPSEWCLEDGTTAASPQTLGATCNRWTSAASSGPPFGTTVNTIVGIPGTTSVTNVMEDCSASHPVACCSP
jgi:hypothetical protein